MGSICFTGDINPLHPTVGDVIKYSSINLARSALSSILSIPQFKTLSSHPLIKIFTKGVFNTRPPNPRYTTTWDLGKVLTYFRTLGANTSLSFKHLTHKLTSLLMILSAQRVNYISSLSVQAMDLGLLI